MRTLQLITFGVLAMFLAGRSWADTFIFHDVGGSITGEHYGTAYTNVNVGTGAFFGEIPFGGLPFLESTSWFLAKDLGLGCCSGTLRYGYFDLDYQSRYIYDQTGAVSDYIEALPGDQGTVQINFASVADGTPPFTSPFLDPPPPGTPGIVEDGHVQDAIHITWQDGSSDTIQFESDVPEPSSLLLVATLLLPLLRRRRHIKRR